MTAASPADGRQRWHYLARHAALAGVRRRPYRQVFGLARQDARYPGLDCRAPVTRSMKALRAVRIGTGVRCHALSSHCGGF